MYLSICPFINKRVHPSIYVSDHPSEPSIHQEAVRDEDNRLMRIHDVVQQLPPPHYRTLEYLMRHLARVAALGAETEMHSKNLAIVWAPNLLR